MFTPKTSASSTGSAFNQIISIKGRSGLPVSFPFMILAILKATRIICHIFSNISRKMMSQLDGLTHLVALKDFGNQKQRFFE